MHLIVLLSAVAFWSFVALFFVLIFLKKLVNTRRLQGPKTYPYQQFLRYRISGGLGALLAKAGAASYRRIPPEIIQAFRTTTLADLKGLRDSLLELDKLPTIEKGKRELGLKSIFEVPSKSVHLIESPYTHPLQTPPYYLPGVPARSFYDPSEFEWVKPLEEAYPVIREELLQLLAKKEGFSAYMTEHQQVIAGWNSFNFFFYGKKFEENCARCPETTRILESLPRFEKDHIMFSALNPHAIIPPHTGPMNGIIRGHLAMIAPPGSYIKVGDEEQAWVEGKVMVFDDSFVHQVWNHSDHIRIVLFMNFWHPCFSKEEIAALERFRTAYERSPLSRLHAENQQVKRPSSMVMKAPPKPAAPALA